MAIVSGTDAKAFRGFLHAHRRPTNGTFRGGGGAWPGPYSKYVETDRWTLSSESPDSEHSGHGERQSTSRDGNERAHFHFEQECSKRHHGGCEKQGKH